MKKLLFLSLLATFLITSCTDPSPSLPRSTPEAEKFSAEALNNYLTAVDTSTQNQLESFMLVRHGKVISEKWYNNNTPQTQYRTYSTSKTFTGIAIGFAINEKLITINDKVASFFPNDLPDSISPYISEMKIKDLLTMTTGHDTDPTALASDDEGSWEQIFFAAPVIHKPGTHFVYNSLASYMLSGIIQKVTGMEMIAYLTPRLFQPLHITGARWTNSPTGINVGGDGLYVTTEDMAKFGQFLLNKGEWNGKQLLPKEWIEEASRMHVPLPQDAPKPDNGYCYQMWRQPHDGFMAHGHLGQIILVLPDQDAVIINTANSKTKQPQEDHIWNYLYPGFE